MCFSISVNALCLFGMSRSYHKRRFRDYLLISLTVCDILRVSFTTPFEVRGLLNRSLSGEENVCKPISFFMYMLEFTSIAHVTVMVLDRYICMCRPTQALNIYLKPKRIGQAILLSYLNGCFWAFLPLIGLGSYGFQIHEIQCGLKPLHDIKSKAYISLVLFLANGLPITISFACLLQIKKKLNANIDSVGISNNNNNNNISNSNSSLERKDRKDLLIYFAKDRKQVQMILALIVSFIMTWFVYHTILFKEMFFADQPNVYLGVVSNFIAHSSALVTPIIILYFNPDLQRTLVRIAGHQGRELQGRELQSRSVRSSKISDLQTNEHVV